MNCSGIYQIQCKCEAKYIGRTTRKFKQRYREHKYSFIYNLPDKSKFAAHLLNNHHTFDQNNFTINRIIHNNKLIDTWEQLEIFKANSSGIIINEQLPNLNNPLYKIITNKF